TGWRNAGRFARCSALFVRALNALHVKITPAGPAWERCSRYTLFELRYELALVERDLRAGREPRGKIGNLVVAHPGAGEDARRHPREELLSAEPLDDVAVAIELVDLHGVLGAGGGCFPRERNGEREPRERTARDGHDHERGPRLLFGVAHKGRRLLL